MTTRVGRFGGCLFSCVVVLVVVGFLFGVTPSPASAALRTSGQAPEVSPEVYDQLETDGFADIYVTVDDTGLAPVSGHGAANYWRNQAVQARGRQLLDDVREEVQGPTAPPTSRYVAMRVDRRGLDALLENGNVASVNVNHANKPLLAGSVKTIGAPMAWDLGDTGAGESVAIIDSGVDKDHPMLAGKVVAEACFSAHPPVPLSNIESTCPGDAPSAEGPGAGVPCTEVPDACRHGTHVAGIAAGNNGPPEAPAGVARDANIVAIKVFTKVDIPVVCGGVLFSPCLIAFDADMLSALDWVDQHRDDFHIAAANMSIGGPPLSSTNCDSSHPDYVSVINRLRSHGVATAIAAGNDGARAGISSPACVSGAISVGSIDYATTKVSTFSNSSSSLDLLAPGAKNTSGVWQGIVSSVPGGDYDSFLGTSMATPHVVGAIAVLRQAYGDSLTVDQAEFLLKTTGRPVTDTRNGITKPLIALDEAVPHPRGTFHPLSPSRVLDTRDGTGAPKAKVGAGKGIDVQITGHAGVPTTGVSAVVVNLTSVSPSGGGYVTAYPSGPPAPLASNLNLVGGDVRPNLAIVRVGVDGKVGFYNAQGTTDLVADVEGYFDGVSTTPGQPNTGDYFHPTAPVRVLDTRSGVGAPAAKVSAAGTITVDASSGSSPVPAGASAVVLNVTATSATADTFVTAFPGDAGSPPLASNLNLGPGTTRPNAVIVPVDSDGNLKLYNNAGSVHLIADVLGWFDGSPGSRFVPTAPSRVLDTRTGVGLSGVFGPETTRLLSLVGKGTIPTSGVTGIVLNVTAVSPTGDGYVTVFPGDVATAPLASNLNLQPFVDTPNLVVTRVGAGGVKLFNKANLVHLVADAAGWFE